MKTKWTAEHFCSFILYVELPLAWSWLLHGKCAVEHEQDNQEH